MDGSFWEHASELRQTLLRALCIIVCAFLLCCTYHQAIFQLLMQPLRHLDATTEHPTNLKMLVVEHQRLVNDTPQEINYHLPDEATVILAIPEGVQKIAARTYRLPSQGYVEIQYTRPPVKLMILGPVDGFTCVLKVCFWCGLTGSAPLWMACLLQFIAPALNGRTQRYVLPFFLLTCLFLMLGLWFAFHVTIPLANSYLYHFNAAIGTNGWTLANYLNYTVLLMAASGLAFEIFAVLLLLIQLQVISAQYLATHRKLAIVGSFVLGALLTPPDVPSQLMMAGVLIVFYEMAIWYGRLRTLTLR